MANKFFRMLKENWIGGLLGAVSMFVLPSILPESLVLSLFTIPSLISGFITNMFWPNSGLGAIVYILLFNIIILYVIGAFIQSRIKK